jgi:V8-like Glu-specific endopeptidase
MRHLKSVLALVLVLGFAAPAARAQQEIQEYPGLETGKMWTFDVPPLEYWARRYNFNATPQWLENVRMSALRQPGCTASFVSADGLVMTNHHCARGCVANVTREGEDLLTNGFYAATRGEERACPGMYVDQLQQITDVTERVLGAVPAGTPATRASDLRGEAITAVERECSAGQPTLNCQVVSFYRGGQYKLYKFRRYSDIRLVFAPELGIAFFGGDPDNFTYPRHDLDMSFYRAYDNNQPVRPTNYFRWSRNGTNAGDLVFVVGNPGSTGRLNTVATLEYLRDVQYPMSLANLRRMLETYRAIAAAHPDRANALRNQIFGISNSEKASTGYHGGLLDRQLMDRKRAWEAEFRGRVNADANLRRQYGDAWDQIARIRRTMTTLFKQRTYHGFSAYGTRLLNYAGVIVRMPVEMAKPDSARMMPFREANRAGLERQLYAATPIDTVTEVRLLAAYLSAMAADMPATDPVLRAALGGKTPEQAAHDMVRGTQIATADQRRALVQGGAAAIAASTDPFIQLARVIEPLQRSLDRQWTDLANQEAQHNERVARALLAVYGNSVSPDATFSLRIQDGEVRSYAYNGTWAQPYTTFAGLYDRWAGWAGRDPWTLPTRWIQRRDSLNLLTPLNAVSTNDIIGGNSGSPVINRDAEIVGLVFDGNMESLPGNFLYTERLNRTVYVDSRGIIEALRRVYDARALAEELTGGR